MSVAYPELIQVPGIALLKHPVPVPQAPSYAEVPGGILTPPKPILGIQTSNGGYQLTWDTCNNIYCAFTLSYEVFSYKETDRNQDVSLWKMIAEVDGGTIPQIFDIPPLEHGIRHYFTMRAIDAYYRVGPAGNPVSIVQERRQ